MVVRQAHNLKVAGSSPASATNTGTRGRSTLNRLRAIYTRYVYG